MRGISNNAWQQPQRLVFPAHLFSIFCRSSFCSSGSHLQGLVSKQKDLTLCSHLVNTCRVIQSKRLYSGVVGTSASKKKLKL